MSDDSDKLDKTRQLLSSINDRIDALMKKSIKGIQSNESKEFTQTIFESEWSATSQSLSVAQSKWLFDAKTKLLAENWIQSWTVSDIKIIAEKTIINADNTYRYDVKIRAKITV